MDYETFRREYMAGGLSLNQLDPDPLVQFRQWLDQAIESELLDPTAMVLATRDSSCGLWQRIVLCKGVDEHGFSFFTNYESDKAAAIDQSSEASLLFPWNGIDRQVIVAGRVSRLSEDVSAEYFATRPRGSQLAAWASRQSQPLQRREALEAEVARFARQFQGEDVPLPPFWGGYVVAPHTIEFWQGRENRLHDRFRYFRREDDAWSITQLQP